MTLPQPKFRQDFDQLIKNTLQAKTANCVPSPYLWKQLKGKLQPVSLSFFQSFTFRSTLVAQLVIFLLVLSIGGIDALFFTQLGITSARLNYTTPQFLPLPQTAMGTDAENRQFISHTPPIVDDLEIKTLNTLSTQRLVSSHRQLPTGQPLYIPPTDVIPNAYSPQGRLLNLQPPSPSPRSNQVIVQPGGPGTGASE